MKVLLINPETPDFLDNSIKYIPLSLLHLGSYIEKYGHKAAILDLNVLDYVQGLSKKQILFDVIDVVKPDLIGIGCLFSGNFPKVLEYTIWIKEKYHIPIIIGGIHPTIYAEEIIENCPSVDFVCVGEGERVLRKLLDNFNLYSFGSILSADSFIDSSDEFPVLNYDLIDLSDYYHDTSSWYNPHNLRFNTSVPLLSSRGCPMNCNFCSMFLVMGRGCRTRDHKKVVDEIELLYHKYGQNHFSFMDDNLTFYKDRVIDLCNEIVKRNLIIQFETPNGISMKFLDEEILDALVSAGLIRVSLAIESGSEYIRNQIMKKHVSQQQICYILDLIKRYKDLYVRTFFILGMPEDTHETLKETYDLTVDYPVDKPCMTNIIPFPGTALFKQCIKDNLFVETFSLEDMWQFNKFYYSGNKEFFIKPYNLSLEDLSLWRQKFDNLIAKQVKENKRNGL